MADKIILVCGFGRCGSSMVMQMLKAAGIDMDGVPPYYETPLCFDGEWISQQVGRAVKVLEPHRKGRVYPKADFICIWLDRDIKQQARSHVKFHREKKGLVVMNPRYSRKKVMEYFKTERSKAVKLCESLGPTLILEFEELVSRPLKCAYLIAEHCGIDIRGNLKRMSEAVIRRDPECRKGLEMEIFLSGGL